MKVIAESNLRCALKATYYHDKITTHTVLYLKMWLADAFSEAFSSGMKHDEVATLIANELISLRRRAKGK